MHSQGLVNRCFEMPLQEAKHWLVYHAVSYNYLLYKALVVDEVRPHDGAVTIEVYVGVPLVYSISARLTAV